jgi:hypothetical protein
MSQIQQRFASFGKHKPISGDFVPKSTKELGVSKVHARRASDDRAILPAVGIRNGLIAGAAIWLAILTILAGMAS